MIPVHMIADVCAAITALTLGVLAYSPAMICAPTVERRDRE